MIEVTWDDKGTGSCRGDRGDGVTGVTVATGATGVTGVTDALGAGSATNDVAVI